jgi:hypothetical protein
MDKFIEDLGFRIADNPDIAIGLSVIGVVAGIILAYRAVTRDQLNDYRVLAVVLGLGLTAGIAFGVPYVHHRADEACDRWSASAEPADELRFLSHECAAHF